MLRVIVAPDSLKGSLPAEEAAAAIADGWRSVRPDDEVLSIPQADGGEGTLDAIEVASPGAVRRSAGQVTGPDGRPTPGEWLQLDDGTAVVELAQASGLPLMHRLDPLHATTRGTGEVIAAALEAGATSIVVGLGGSASTDGGTGALSALGLRLLDAEGRPVPDGAAGLEHVHTLDSSALLPIPGGVTLLSDVTAPLLGPAGAAAVFGPQKGAGPDTVVRLEAALARLAGLLGGDPSRPGAGAAGGTGYGFATVYAARTMPGSVHVAQLTGLTDAIAAADVLITGEGRYDSQSTTGKVVGHALALAAAAGIRAAVIAGQLGADPTEGPDAPAAWAVDLVGLAGSTAGALGDPARWLREAAIGAARALG